MKLVYLCDGDQKDRDNLKRYLEVYGFSVQEFEDIHGVQAAIAKKAPDLLLQEVVFADPDSDGFLFVKKLRQTSDFPVFFVTGRSSESDRITGFEVGCDDYICKPYSSKELVLRIEALFRRIDRLRRHSAGGSRWALDGSVLTMDEAGHTFLLDGKPLALTAAEWRVMSYLVANAEATLKREQILEYCFDYGLDSYDRIVDTHIKNIRSKMGPMGNQWIVTVRAWGYKFMGKSVQGGTNG